MERADVRRLLREIELRQDVRAGAIFSLFLYSGCRISDLVVLELSDLIIGERSGSVVWFADANNFDEATAGTSDAAADEDDSESEYQPDYEAWEARARKVQAAEELLQLASRYEEAFVLLDAVVVAMHGKQGYEQVAKVRGAAAGYHKRAAAALEKKEEGE